MTSKKIALIYKILDMIEYIRKKEIYKIYIFMIFENSESKKNIFKDF